MPDNTTEIARLQSILNTGVKTVNIDGQVVAIDPASIREQIRTLKRTDDANRTRRPFCSNINLGGT